MKKATKNLYNRIIDIIHQKTSFYLIIIAIAIAQPALSQNFDFASDAGLSTTKCGGCGSIGNNGGSYGGSGFNVNGSHFTKGIGLASDGTGTYTFDISGKGYVRFTALLANTNGGGCGAGKKLGFEILLDNVSVLTAPNLTNASTPVAANLNVTGVNEIKIIVNDGGDGPGCDDASVVNAKLFTTYAPATSLSIDASGVTTVSGNGGNITITSTSLPATASQDVFWAVTGNATIDAFGKLTTTSNTTEVLQVTATAFDPSTITNTYVLTVIPAALTPLTGITISGSNTINTANGVNVLNALTSPSDAATPVSINWTISNPTIATLSNTSGSIVSVTGIRDGAVTITGAANNPAFNAVTTKFVLNLTNQPAAALFTYASDLPFQKTGTANKDVNYGGAAIILNGVTYTKGIGSEAYASITFTGLNGSYSKFTAITGIQDAVGGKSGFQFITDGTQVYETANLEGANTENIDVNLTGVNTLVINVTDGGNGPSSDWANIADAKLFIQFPATSLFIAPAGNITTIAGNGSIVSFSGSVLPFYADQSVIWSIASNLSGAADIDASTGILTVTGNENTVLTITGTVESTPSIQASYVLTVVSVPIPITSIDLIGTSSLLSGEVTLLSVDYLPVNTNQKSVTWTSSNNAIATVQNGTVTGVSSGVVTITATSVSNAGVVAIKVITISTPVSSVNLSGTNTLIIGEMTTLTADILPLGASDKSLTWASSNTAIATVSNGVWNAISVGIVTITATSVSNPAITGSILVSVLPINVTSISITGANTLTVGGTSSFTAIVTPLNATFQDVVWSSSNSAVATVNNSGVVIALTAGDATITATSVSTSGISGSLIISVVVAPLITTPGAISLTLTAAPVAITIKGGTSQITATLIPASTLTGFAYSVSNPAIATIDGNGVITALKDGIITVTGSLSGYTITGSVVLSISGQNVLDVEDEIAGNTILVYPNPASDKINIASNVTVLNTALFNNQGTLILTQNGNLFIPLNGLSKGLYLLKINTVKGLVLKTITVE